MNRTLGYLYADDQDLLDYSDPAMIKACTQMDLVLTLGELEEDDSGVFSRLYVVEGDPAKWAGYLSNVTASMELKGVQFKFTMEVHEYEH